MTDHVCKPADGAGPAHYLKPYYRWLCSCGEVWSVVRDDGFPLDANLLGRRCRCEWVQV